MEELIAGLSWNESVDRQSEAVALLLAADDRLDLSLILRRGDKSCWQNEARVLLGMGYPRFREVIPAMLEWLQDLNWPGSDEIVQALASMPKDDLVGRVSTAVESAMSSSDTDWLFGLRYLARETELVPELFVGENVRAALFGEEAES